MTQIEDAYRKALEIKRKKEESAKKKGQAGQAFSASVTLPKGDGNQVASAGENLSQVRHESERTETRVGPQTSSPSRPVPPKATQYNGGQAKSSTTRRSSGGFKVIRKVAEPVASPQAITAKVPLPSSSSRPICPTFRTPEGEVIKKSCSNCARPRNREEMCGTELCEDWEYAQDFRDNPVAPGALPREKRDPYEGFGAPPEPTGYRRPMPGWYPAFVHDDYET